MWTMRRARRASAGESAREARYRKAATRPGERPDRRVGDRRNATQGGTPTQTHLRAACPPRSRPPA
eukprot:15441387-Alexandrium_andersonii.AAC.1